MAKGKEITTGFTIDLSDPTDPFRRILESIVNTYAQDFKNVPEDEAILKPTRKLATGLIDRFAGLEGIKIPYGDESNKTLTMNSGLRAFEALGLVKKGTQKVGGSTLNTWNFTDEMDNIINLVKTGQTPAEALTSSLPQLAPPTTPELPKGRKGIGYRTPDVSEKSVLPPTAEPEPTLARQAREFLEQQGKKVPKQIAGKAAEEVEETVTAREAIEMIIKASREKTSAAATEAEKKALEKLAGKPFKEIPQQLVEAFMKNRGKIIKGALPVLAGGVAGLAAKGAEALEYVMEPTPVGLSPENIGLGEARQLRDLAVQLQDEAGNIDRQKLDELIKGGDPTAQRLQMYRSESPLRTVQDYEELVTQREAPLKQGAAMQEDLQRSMAFRNQMQKLMEQRQQQR